MTPCALLRAALARLRILVDGLDLEDALVIGSQRS
jgi:hypothetical protein